MASRSAGKDAAYQQPPRDEFHRLSEDQRNQITEAVGLCFLLAFGDFLHEG